MMDTTRRTESLNSSTLIPSFFLRSTTSMSHSLCGERNMLLLLSSRHVVLSRSVFTRSSTLSSRQRTLSSGQRLGTWNHKNFRRMSLNGFCGTSQWVDWDRSDLLVKMRSGLLVSDRPFLLDSDYCGDTTLG